MSMTWYEKFKELNSYNVRNIIEGTYNKMKDDSVFMELDDHIKEQALWRASKCAPCLKNGECFFCGCDTPDVFYSNKKIDSQLKWAEMLDENEWELFKDCNFYSVLTEQIYYNQDSKSAWFVTHYIDSLDKYGREKKFDYVFINFQKFIYSDIVCSPSEMSSVIKIPMSEKEFRACHERIKKLFDKKLDNPKYDNKRETVINITASNVNDNDTLTPEIFNFGNAVKGDKVNASFIIKNVCEAGIVKINSVKTSCGCTTANGITNALVKPGEGYKLDLVVDTANKMNAVTVNIIISVEHDKKTYDYAMLIKGNVQPA